MSEGPHPAVLLGVQDQGLTDPKADWGTALEPGWETAWVDSQHGNKPEPPDRHDEIDDPDAKLDVRRFGDRPEVHRGPTTWRLEAIAKGELTPDQQRRVHALNAARAALARKPAPFGSTTVDERFTVDDLTRVADWILAGDQTVACRACGCTDTEACPGGCYWIEPGLCSTCGSWGRGAAVPEGPQA